MVALVLVQALMLQLMLMRMLVASVADSDQITKVVTAEATWALVVTAVDMV
jgi:hypothetical protein